MPNPSWLKGVTLKTRSDRPDDPPLEGPGQGPNRALERARGRQNRRLAQGSPAPGEGKARYERILRSRRKVRHSNDDVQRLAQRLYNVYVEGTGDYRQFDTLDHRRSIFGHRSPKERWWYVAEEVLRSLSEPSKGYGCIQP